jgi:hypothetical protein
MENQWPPIALDDLAAVRESEPRCAGDGLSLTPRGPAGRALISLWVAGPGIYRAHASARGDLRLTFQGVDGELALDPQDPATPGCRSLTGEVRAPASGNLRVWLETATGAFVDYIELTAGQPGPEGPFQEEPPEPAGSL